MGARIKDGYADDKYPNAVYDACRDALSDARWGLGDSYKLIGYDVGMSHDFIYFLSYLNFCLQT